MKNEIHEAYRFLQENNHTISDEALDFIKEAALKELDKKKPTRHPSEITLAELIEIANIITFETDGCYMDTPYGKTGSNVMLRNKNGKILILIGLGENGFVLSVGTGRNFKLEFPHFSESIQIAAYLDSIGIEYRSKSEEQ